MGLEECLRKCLGAKDALPPRPAVAFFSIGVDRKDLVGDLAFASWMKRVGLSLDNDDELFVGLAIAKWFGRDDGETVVESAYLY